MKPIRRKLVRWLGAGLPISGLAGLAGLSSTGIARANQQKGRKTPSEPEGPFYPVNWDGDVDANLRAFTPTGDYQQGEPLTLQGRILRADGTPASNATVAIWQTDHTGRYRHPRDEGEAPAKRGFQGYGRLKTDSDGRYRFETIKPVPYGSRPAHVHFRVDDNDATLITQMYFEGENKEGGFLSSIWASDRSMLTVKPTAQDSGVLLAEFDIYL